jgi:hypothetical protein
MIRMSCNQLLKPVSCLVSQTHIAANVRETLGCLF